MRCAFCSAFCVHRELELGLPVSKAGNLEMEMNIPMVDDADVPRLHTSRCT